MSDDSGSAENAIHNAIQNAERVIDPVDHMLKLAATDPGVPFTPENVKLLAAIKLDDRARYETVRHKLKAQHVRIGELESEIGRLTREGDADHSNRQLSWPADEPWHEVVDGAGLLDEIVSILKTYLSLPEHAAEAIATWIIFSHSADLWHVAPILALTSPEKRCGKTTTLSVVQSLVLRPLPASNITPAALFRSIERYCPTLLIDEADTFLNDNHELRGIINSGHTRAQAFVVRSVGDDHEPAKFSTWGPKVIAKIGDLPDTISDRSIAIQLRRKSVDEKLARFRVDRADELKSLRSKIRRWVDDNAAALCVWNGELPTGLNDRAADNWSSSFAIANIAGGDWPERIWRAALALTGANEDDSAATLLLRDIAALFDTRREDRMATQFMLEKLNGMEERPWSEWRQGKSMTANQLARLLKPFGIRPTTMRLGGQTTGKGYARASFDDAFRRYIPEAVTPSQRHEINSLTKAMGVTPDDPVTLGNPSKPLMKNDCYAVTDPNKVSHQEEVPRKRVVI